MRTLFKKFIYRLFDTLSYLIPIKSRLELNSSIDIVILFQKPLGIGDLVMLSPLVILLEEKFIENNIYIVTEYEKFIDFDRASWIHPSNLNKNLLVNSIVISPMLVFTHLKYMFQAKYFIGYFLTHSNKTIWEMAASDDYQQLHLNQSVTVYHTESQHFIKERRFISVVVIHHHNYSILVILILSWLGIRRLRYSL